MKKLCLLALVVVLLLVGCGQSEPKPVTSVEVTASTVIPTTAPDEPVELIVWADELIFNRWNAHTDNPDEFVTYLREGFKEKYPNVTVTLIHQGWGEPLRQNLFNAIQAGSAPDIVVGENFFREFAARGELLPLDGVIDDIKNDLITTTYRAAEYNGQIYALSAYTGVFGFERNCRVVEAAGLDCDSPPKDWAELLDQARQINEQGQGDYYGFVLRGPNRWLVGAPFRVAVFLEQAGATICRNQCTEPYFNDPKAIPVMEFLREINRYTPPGITFHDDEAEGFRHLWLGKSAYQLAGSWHPDLAKVAGCEDCRYSSVPLPPDGQEASMVVGNIMYAVTSQTQYPDVATAWVKFLVSNDVQDLTYRTLGWLPSTRPALTALRPEADPAMQAFIDQLLNNPSLGILPQWSTDSQGVWRIYNDMLTGVLTTNRPVKEIMDEAQAKAEVLFQ